MKKVIIAVSVLLIASLAVWGCAQPPAVPEVPTVPEVRYPSVIYVGGVHNLTGGCAPFGIQQAVGGQLAVDQINASGGIKSMGGAKLEFVIGDGQTSPDANATETERLITTEDVVVVMGGFAITVPIMVQCQKYKTVFLSPVMGCHIPSDYDWCFRDFNAMEYDWEEILGAIKYFSEATGVGPPKTVAQIACDCDWGKTTASIGLEAMTTAGIEVVYNDSFSGGCTDFMPYLLKAKAANADMFMIHASSPAHTFFTTQLWESKIDFPYGVLSSGAAVEDVAFYDTVTPEMTEYYFVQEDADIWASRRPWYNYLNTPEIKAKLGGMDLGTYGLCQYGVMWDVKDALERTTYHTDINMFRSNFRDALEKTDITFANSPDNITLPDGTTFCPALVRGIDRVKFSQGHRPGDLYWQNTYSHGTISQQFIIGGEIVRIPVYPRVQHPADAPADYVWPTPAWADR